MIPTSYAMAASDWMPAAHKPELSPARTSKMEDIEFSGLGKFEEVRGKAQRPSVVDPQPNVGSQPKGLAIVFNGSNSVGIPTAMVP
jgi:hypothetical protein